MSTIPVTSIYDPIVILHKYLFGTVTPSADDYNLHIRPSDATPDSVTYNAQVYMDSGAGRFAYPSLFGAVQKFFASSTLQNGTYNISVPSERLALFEQLGLTDTDLKIEISQYGTNPFSADYAERALIFGTTWFDLTNASFKVENGIKTITELVIAPEADNFDFVSGNPCNGLV